MHYSVPFEDVASGAVVGTFKSLASVIAGAGKRAKIRAIRVGFGGEAADDINMTLQLIRGTTDGTGSAVTPVQRDMLSAAAGCTAKKNYSVECADLESLPVCEFGLNSRGTAFLEWGPQEAPVVNASKCIFLRATPGAATARKMSGVIEFEEV